MKYRKRATMLCFIGLVIVLIISCKNLNSPEGTVKVPEEIPLKENPGYDTSNSAVVDNGMESAADRTNSDTAQGTNATIDGTNNENTQGTKATIDGANNEITQGTNAATENGSERQGEESEFRPLASLYVNGEGVRMREAPSTGADILMSLNLGTIVEKLHTEGDWSKVSYKKATGYIRNDLLSEEKPTERPATEALVLGSAAYNITSPKIIVKKQERILELWDGEALFGSYPIGLGWEPIGDKKVEGDGRTPEGDYYVCVRNSNSRFYLSLGLSYPNKEDAREALNAGTINQSTYRLITDAIDRKAQPPWNTPMGGEIMIHGMGSSTDWTAGCVAVDNDIMDILWRNCPNKTPVTILP